MKKLLLVFSLILLGFTYSFADTIFTTKPNLRAWNPDFTYEIFSDPFSGSTLDQSKWNVDLCQGRHGPPYHDILTSNQGEPDNIQVSNGILKLIARHEPNNTNNECWAGPFTSNYTTAEISTKRPQYSYRYSIFEARCKMPRGYGLFPAYWLWGSGDSNGYPSDGYSSEIDIAEAIQKTSNDKFIHVFHWWHGSEIPINDGEKNFGTSYLGNWHTYKIIWTPYEVLFYVDGIKTWGRSKYYYGSDDGWRNDVFSSQIQPGVNYKVHEWFPRHICETRLQMQLNNNIVGRESSLLPAVFEVDYVTVREFFLSPKITCPKLICSSGTATLDVDSKASNITWNLSPSGLFTGATSGSGKIASINAGSAIGEGKITYSFEMPGGETFEAEETFWVGKPSLDVSSEFFKIISADGGSDYVCTDQAGNEFDLSYFNNKCGCTNYEIKLTGLNGITVYDQFYTSGNGDLDYPYLSEGWYIIWARGYNACGWGDWVSTELEFRDCSQMLLFFTPNPTAGETTLSIVSSSNEKIIDDFTEWDLEIYSPMQALKTKKTRLKGKSTTIQTAGWTEGVYSVRVKYQNEILTGKLVVKR